MKFRLGTDALERDLMEIGSQKVRVGVLDKNMKAARPERPLRQLQLMPGVKRNAVQTKGRSKNERLAAVAEYLNEKVGLFDKALGRAGNADINEIAQYFADLVLDPSSSDSTKKRLENLCLSIVRNPIARRELGANADSTEEDKGFNHYGINTGTLFKNIKAKYERD